MFRNGFRGDFKQSSGFNCEYNIYIYNRIMRIIKKIINNNIYIYTRYDMLCLDMDMIMYIYIYICIHCIYIYIYMINLEHFLRDLDMSKFQT